MTEPSQRRDRGDNLPMEEEELVPADDSVIGRAFRRSVVLIVILLVIAGSSFWWLSRPPKALPTVVTTFTPPQKIATDAKPPTVRFTDVTREAGIDFIHINGAYGDKLLPETMGSGCAFFDYDNDGDADLLFVNSTYWPDHKPANAPIPTHRLYRNDGKGHFEDVTHASGLDVSDYGMGIAVGDYDNDRDEDVYITTVGTNHLFRNDGGKFTEVTNAAHVAGDANAWSTGAGFFDYDNDSDLDLFVCNYVKWSKDIDFAVDYRLTGVGRAYGPPMNFQGAHSVLYRNNGDGTFADVSATAGIQVANTATGVPVGKALGLVFADFDRDGWMDIFVANDTVQKFLFHNRHDGTFEEIGAAAGVAYDMMGNATGAMGADIADYRNDRTSGIAVANFANEMSSLYLADRDPLQFTDVAMVEGIGAPSRAFLSFGLFFFDYDLDGRLDLLQCNGHIEDEINRVQASQQFRQPAQLFWNVGPAYRASFVEVARESTGDLVRPLVGRGAAYADIDGDGDLDVVLTQSGGHAMLLRNDQALGEHWLRLKLVGSKSNRDAIGAKVELTVGGLTQWRTVMPTRSYLSQVELPVTFGLGKKDHVENLQIIWPSGQVQNVAPLPPINKLTILREP